MKLLRYNARFDRGNETFVLWKKVNEVIKENMTPEIREQWMKDGYEGIAGSATKYFGINRIYRDEEQSMTFEFTDQQWTMFMLRWA
jgi:hypothetical protein